MTAWLKSLRLPICFLASLLAVAGFRLGSRPMSWLAVAAVFFIACSTMLQNDWRDRHHDGRKGKLLALQCPRAFLAWLLAFWFVAGGLALTVTMANGKVGLMLFAMIFAGLIYSETRKVPLVPITLVALTSASPALLAVAAGARGNQAWLLFLAATLFIFGREITMDLDDCRIDRGYKWTIPLALGSRWAKAIAIMAIMAGFVSAASISKAVLPAWLFAVAGVVLLIRGIRPRIARICLDMGVALAILTLIIMS